MSGPAISRRAAAVLLALTLVALGLRLWIAWSTNAQLPDTPARLVGDEAGYDYLAWSLFEGRFFDWPGRTPVYPVFLASVYAVFGHSYAAVLYAQAALGAAAVPLSYLVARRYTGEAGSLLAAAIVATHGPLILHTQRLYTEVLFTVLLLLLLLALRWALDRPTAGRVAGFGAVLAVANLCRPTLALFPLVLPLLLPRAMPVRRRLATTLVCVGTVVALTAPWTYHNWRIHGTLLPFSVSVAALWQGSPEMYRFERQGRGLLDVWAKELNPMVNGGHDPFTIEGDRWFNRRAIASIRREPATYAKYCVLKAGYFWIGSPMVDWPGGRFFDATALRPWFGWTRIATTMFARMLPLVTLIALVVLRRRLGELLPLVALAAYLTAIHAVTYAEARYSDPLVPLLATVIGAAAAELVAARRLTSAAAAVTAS